jgi:hypothetical protein
MIARGKRKRAAPGEGVTLLRALKGRQREFQTLNAHVSPFQGCMILMVFTQGRRASRLPLATICRAFGAQLVTGPRLLQEALKCMGIPDVPVKSDRPSGTYGSVNFCG